MKAEFYYEDNGMVDSTDPVCFQFVFETMTGLFEWVGLQTNFCETVRMVFNTCRAAGVWADKSYTWQMTG